MSVEFLGGDASVYVARGGRACEVRVRMHFSDQERSQSESGRVLNSVELRAGGEGYSHGSSSRKSRERSHMYMDMGFFPSRRARAGPYYQL